MPSFGDPDAALLIVGLAPGVQGANRTGRPFTGDFAGDLLYATLLEYGFANGVYQARPDDGLKLVDCRISNAVRCVPPQNKPLPVEINTCRQFLIATIAAMPKLRAIVALGRVAHDSMLKVLGLRAAAAPFAHGAVHQAGALNSTTAIIARATTPTPGADAGDVSQRVREGAERIWIVAVAASPVTCGARSSRCLEGRAQTVLAMPRLCSASRKSAHAQR